MIDPQVKFELLGELEKINRKDLWAKPECLEYWSKEENPSVEECIEFLLEKFPEKKIYTKVTKDDPFRD